MAKLLCFPSAGVRATARPHHRATLRTGACEGIESMVTRWKYFGLQTSKYLSCTNNLKQNLVLVLLPLLLGLIVLFALFPRNAFAQDRAMLYLPFASGGQEFPIIENQFIVVLKTVEPTGDLPVAISSVDQANALVAHYGG